jgi:hypothetical protein
MYIQLNRCIRRPQGLDVRLVLTHSQALAPLVKMYHETEYFPKQSIYVYARCKGVFFFDVVSPLYGMRLTKG